MPQASLITDYLDVLSGQLPGRWSRSWPMGSTKPISTT